MKGVDWHSVIIPVICPKPELAVLTGGYVRTPVLQIGADIHCDTLAILAALERLAPEPTLYPAPLGAGHRALALEAGGTNFFSAVGVALGDMPAEGNHAFWLDRQQRFGMDPVTFRGMLPGLKAGFAAHVAHLERLLADGRPYLGGDAPGHGDLAHYMLLWFAARGQGAASISPNLAPWAERIAALGHGRPKPLSAEAAIALAQAHAPAPLLHGVTPGAGFRQGQGIAVAQHGSNDPPVEGDLVALDQQSVVVARHDPRAGDVHVHFPREGQRLSPIRLD
jgi:glutathione S-transferase